MTTQREILARMRVYPRRNVFQLGCTALILNVHAQQQRAFNLAWALDQSHQLTDETVVAVIGAGIAGITATIALAAAGVSVHLYDKKTAVMHLQSGNLTRCLHPNIAVWPDRAFGHPLTNLPFCNWRAETTGHVVDQIQRQWKTALVEFKDRIDTTRLGSEVYEVDCQSATPNFVVKSRARETEYQIVIIAAGYGIEQPSKSHTPSYWRNDDYAQPTPLATVPKKYFVSGVGDGGLIDVLRLTIDRFHHQRFLHSVMKTIG